MADIVISEIQIMPVKPQNGLLAFTSFVINESIYVGDVAIHGRLDGMGYRLVFPAKVLPNGKVIQCVHPVTRQAGEVILNAVVGKFERLIKNSQSGK